MACDPAAPDGAPEVVRHVREVLASRARSGTRWVGVDGYGGAGKSSLAERLQAALPGSALVAVDDFARPGLTTWDHDRFRTQLVGPLNAGRAARYQRWGWGRAAAGDWVTVAPGTIVVVEGVSATDQRLGLDWDVTLWVDAPGEERLRRVLARDGEAMRRVWLEEWIPSEQAYVAAQRPDRRADLVVWGAGGKWTILRVNGDSAPESAAGDR